MKTTFSCFVLFLLVISCKNDANNDKTSNMSVSAMELPPKEMEAEAVVTDSANSTESIIVTSASPTSKEITEPKIIKQGNLRFETNDLETTYTLIQNAVKNHKAIIQNDEEGKNYESLFRNITVRVPSQDFDVFIKEISKGVSYFEKKEISSQDVTEEYIDIDARLKAKKILESRYLELLKKATKVSEMLEIETQLSTIREEIEAKEGQLKFMQNRVSMSTVSVEFYKTIASESGITVSYGTKIWNAIKSGFNGISSFFIGLLQVWPFILSLVAIIYFVRKRFKKKNSA